MAFIDIDNDSDDPTTITFYNVNDSVGSGGKNNTEDVKVVQFFLKRAYLTDELKNGKTWGEMVPDGKCGPITNSWIRKFQIDCNRLGNNTLVDGLIDKANNPQNNRIGSISQTNYTIRLLNNLLRHLDKEVYKNLTTHREVPPDLKLIFLQIQSQGPKMDFGKN
ncbi:MAG TPA: hypothetical protein PKY82_07745 [Pyrinomonadaceae bacterium]|nr:hypothetical protein [Pyrinomonadaceae bacterium]